MKTLALVKRRADHTRDAFRAHYEETHAPLAMQTVLEGTRRYVRHHVRREIHGAPDFDVVTAFWYADEAGARALLARLGTPAGERIRADEESFMDRPAMRFFAVTEEPVTGAPDPTSALQAVALVRRAPGDPGAAFVADYEARAIPRLLDATREPAWCLQNRVAAAGDAPPIFDCVTQLHAADDAGLSAWAQTLEARGASVLVLGVSEHETPTPW